ncbi:biotin-dependent carboxyltransferase family protein [Terasakiella sp. SH-1]|uniref:5-oxoprolinase subunit C family protein n=1 Tax=Terasakiella sp. SH-1 TaxID=2560057 RepID=UPI0010744246|nr:biotin-dependent carboxyltransferase family protein [Terasakiella sp. SH-1]
MNRLEILNPGFQALVQDDGRRGFQEFGVPVSGCVVPDWMVLGNHLVGNADTAAGIEFRLMGPSLCVHGAPVKVVVCGEVTSELIISGQGGPSCHKMPPWRSFTLKPGAELRVGTLENTPAGFIAISGGVDVPVVMNSRSTYARSKIGNWLQAGEMLPVGAVEVWPDCVLPNPPLADTSVVRVVLGPQDDYFEASEIQRFLSSPYVISKAADRMGARLDGPALAHRCEKGAEIPSDGVVSGAIQVPGNGQPIVLLNDGQTVGGYPKIATVISTDVALIANGLSGKEIRFQEVSAREACDIARAHAQQLEQLKRSIIKASANGFIDLQALYESNLIGGVVDMMEEPHETD